MKRSIVNYFLPAAISILSACNISKDIAAPDTALPAAYRGSAQDADSSTIADIPWAAFFTDSSLQHLLAQALEKNYDMQLAWKNIEAASLLYRQVKWNYVPDLRLQVAAGSNRPSDNSLNGISASQFLGTNHIEDYNANIGLSWEADIWGKIRNQKKSALAVYLQTEEARKAIQTGLVAAVANGYYNLLMLDAQLDVARKNLRLGDSTLTMVQLQYSSGQVTALAVAQVEAQRQAAAQLIPALEKDVTLQENALSLLAGALPGAVERGAGLAIAAAPAALPAGFPAQVLSRRPDVRSAELSLEIANARVGIAKANMYPTLNITASAGLNAFKASNWFSMPASLFGTVAGGLVQPLLNKRQLKTQFEVAKVEREKNVLTFRQTVLYAAGDVSDALAKLDKLAEQYSIAESRVHTLEQATGNAGLLFRSGMASYLEVITAQAGVLQGELELLALKRDRLAAAVELYRSLGGGWK